MGASSIGADNDVPSDRVATMPVGEVIDAGLRRKGVRFAMEGMIGICVLAIRRP